MGRCHNSTIVNAPIEDAWAAVREFHDMSWAAPVITSVERVGSAGGTEVGARRILNEAFHEILLEIDDAGRTLSHSIDDGPGPVASHAVEHDRGILTP